MNNYVFAYFYLTADHYLDYGGAILGDPKDTADFHYVTFSDRPKLTDKHKSLMAKHLTPELFEKLKNKKVRFEYLFTLNECIKFLIGVFMFLFIDKERLYFLQLHSDGCSHSSFGSRMHCG